MEAKEILDTMLGHLCFVAEIQEIETESGIQLQVFTAEADALIGHNGETLEDLQFLLTRVLQSTNRNAPRVQVDVGHWRAMRDDKLRQRIRQIAETVRLTGRPVKLEPMNSYDRRIVHNTLKDDPELMSFSPTDDARIKRITIQRRATANHAARIAPKCAHICERCALWRKGPYKSDLSAVGHETSRIMSIAATGTHQV